MYQNKKRFISLLVSLVALSLFAFGCGSSNNDEFVIAQANQPQNNTPLFPTGPPAAVMVVANQGSSSVSSFQINLTTGLIAQLAGSPFSAGAGTAPTEITLAAPTGAPAGTQYLYGTDANSNNLLQFVLNTTTGAITASSQGAVTSVAAPFDIVSDPNGAFVYVVGQTQIDGYAVAPATGALTRLAGFPLSPAGFTSGSMARFQGNLFYAVDGGSNRVFGWTQNQATGALAPIAGTPISTNGVNSLNVASAFSPNGSIFLYVTDSSTQLMGYSVGGGGVLTPLAGFPIAVNGGSTPVANAGEGCGIAAVNFNLYVSDDMKNSTDGFSINNSGALTRLAGFPVVGGGCGPIAVADAGAANIHVYFAGFTQSLINGFRFNPTTGALTAVSNSPFTAGATKPSSVAVFVR